MGENVQLFGGKGNTLPACDRSGELAIKIDDGDGERTMNGHLLASSKEARSPS